MISCKTVREIFNLLTLLVRKSVTLLTKYINIIGRIVTKGNGKLNQIDFLNKNLVLELSKFKITYFSKD